MTLQADPGSRMVSRLLAIDWREHDRRTRSRVLLMREYLRRASWWAEALNANQRWPFFDIAWHVDPAVRAEPVLVTQLEGHLARIPLWPAVSQTCVWALHWATLRSTPGIRLPDLDDPFEPLIRMYERGGGFTTEHGFVQVDLASIRLATWRDHQRPEPVVAVDDGALDRADEGVPDRR